jgi:hypothetical protein
MRLRFKLAALCLIIGPVRAFAQDPVQPVFRLCPTGSPLFTERGVQVPAQFLPDSGVRPSPAPPESKSANVVRFVVDTTGRVEARTFVALRLSDSSLVRRAQNSIGRWRYEPARASGCHVRQLVIAALRP